MSTKIPRYTTSWDPSLGCFPYSATMSWVNYRNPLSYWPRVTVDYTPAQYIPWTPIVFWPPVAWFGLSRLYPYLWPFNWLGYH